MKAANSPVKARGVRRHLTRSVSRKSAVTRVSKILVPLDFSASSLKALAYAMPLAGKLDATLHLLHVVDPAQAPPPSLMVLPVLLPEPEIARRSKQRLTGVAAKFSIPIQSQTCSVRQGRAFEEICGAARELGAGMIAMATHGHTGLKRAFLGSTAERVVQHAPCPVLVVRSAQPETAGAKDGLPGTAKSFRLNTILAPIDFSDCSRAGIDYAVQFAKQFGAKLVLFHSVHVPAYTLSDEYTALEVPNLFRLQEKYAEEEMRKVRESVSGEGIQVETELAFGVPFDQVCDYVEKHDVDLIVTSTHGRSGLKHVLIGSTAEHIVRYAAKPVLVVPSRPGKAAVKSKGTK
jgi:nucleotide-binding universal stress UspA family protein